MKHSELLNIKAGILLIKKEYLDRTDAYDGEKDRVYEKIIDVF